MLSHRDIRRKLPARLVVALGKTVLLFSLVAGALVIPHHAAHSRGLFETLFDSFFPSRPAERNDFHRNRRDLEPLPDYTRLVRARPAALARMMPIRS